MAKKNGALDQMAGGEINVECLENLSNLEAANKIAEHFAAISNEYLPIQYSQLPSYLPALPPPQLEEYEVYMKLNKV